MSLRPESHQVSAITELTPARRGLLGGGGEEVEDDEAAMDQLLEVAMQEEKPIVVLDSILPGQTMRLQISDKAHRAMIARCPSRTNHPPKSPHALTPKAGCGQVWTRRRGRRSAPS